MENLIIDSNECTGCLVCVDLCPTLFINIDEDFIPTPTDMDITDIECAYEVVDFCPFDAISIE